MAAATSVGLGLPNLPLAMVPGHVGNQSKEQLRRHIRDVTSGAVIENLLEQPSEAIDDSEPQSRDIVFAGSFDAVESVLL